MIIITNIYHVKVTEKETCWKVSKRTLVRDRLNAYKMLFFFFLNKCVWLRMIKLMNEKDLSIQQLTSEYLWNQFTSKWSVTVEQKLS